MSARFNLTAELTIRDQITGLAAAKKKIERAVGRFNVKLQIDATRLQAQLRSLNGTLTTTKNLANDVQKSFAAIKSPNVRVTQIQKVQTELRTLSTTAQQVDRSFAGSAKRIATFSAVVGSLYVVSRRLREGLANAVEFQSQLVKVGQITNSSLSSVTNFGKGIRDVGKNFGVAGSDLAGVTQVLSSASFSLKEIEALLPTIAQAKLSPSFENLDNLANGIIVLKQFVNETEDYGKALNSVNQLSNDYAVEAESLVAILKRAGSTYRQTSDDLAGLFAISTALKSSTRLGDGTIGTGLKSIFQSLQSEKSIGIVKGLGGSLTNEQGGAKNPLDAIRELARLNEAFSKTEKGRLQFSQAITDIAGGFQSGKLLSLVQNIELVEKAYRTASSESDSLARNSRLAFQSIDNQLTKTRETFSSFFDSIANSSGFQSSLSNTLSLVRGLTEAAKVLLPLTPILLGALAGKAASRGIGLASAGIQGLNNFTPTGARISSVTAANSPIATPRTDILNLYKREVAAKRANLDAVEQETLARRLTTRALRNDSRVLVGGTGQITQVTSGFQTRGGALLNRAGNLRGGVKAGLGLAAGAGIAAIGAGALGDTAGSTLTGALGGAAAGFAVGGPLGAAIGGVVAGLLSLKSALKEAEKAELQKTRTRLFSAGFSAENTREIANSFISEKLTGSRTARFFRSDEAQKKLIEDFNLGKADQIRPFADAQKAAIEQDIQSGALKSFDDVKKKYGEFSVIADIADDGIRNMSTGLNDFVDKLLFDANRVDEAKQVLQGNRISSEKVAFGIRKKAQNITDNLPSRLTSINNPTQDDFSGLENVGSKKFFQDIKRIGLSGGEVTKLAQLGNARNSIESRLTNQSFSRDGFVQELTSGLRSDGISEAIIESVSKQLDGVKFDEFNDSLGDVAATSDKLISSFRNTTESAKQQAAATKALSERQLENLQALFNQREASRSATANVGLAQLDLTEEKARFRNGPIDILGGENALIASVGGTSKQLSAELLQLTAEFQKTNDAQLGVKAQDTARRLSQLGDSSQRLRGLMEAQARVQSSLLGREANLANFFSSDAEGRRQLEIDRAAANRAADVGLNALSIKEQQAAIRGLQANSDIIGDGGKTGSQVLSELLREARPDFFQKDLQRNNELQGIKEERLSDVIAARQGIADFERENLNFMSSQFDRFARTVAEIDLPSKIEIGGNFNFNVVVNGDSGWDAMKPELVNLVRNEIAKALPKQPPDGPSAGRGARTNGYYSNGQGF